MYASVVLTAVCYIIHKVYNKDGNRIIVTINSGMVAMRARPAPSVIILNVFFAINKTASLVTTGTTTLAGSVEYMLKANQPIQTGYRPLKKN